VGVMIGKMVWEEREDNLVKSFEYSEFLNWRKQKKIFLFTSKKFKKKKNENNT
jgi:hypothetical protein